MWEVLKKGGGIHPLYFIKPDSVLGRAVKALLFFNVLKVLLFESQCSLFFSLILCFEIESSNLK